MICAKLGVPLFVARVANLQTSLVIIVVFINSAKGLQLTLKFHFILCHTKVGIEEFVTSMGTVKTRRNEGLSGPYS